MTAIADLENIIEQIAQRVVRRWAPAHRFGIVSNYDPSGPAVKVQLPDDLDANGNPQLSPWMPIIMPSAGPGAGDIAAPQIGSQAIILEMGWGADKFQFMLGTVRPSTDALPPQPLPPSGPPLPAGAPENERWIVHPQGQSVMLRNDGTVLAGKTLGTYQRLATEQFVLDVFNNHTHGNVQTGSGVSGPPQSPVASGSTTAMTATLKAN